MERPRRKAFLAAAVAFGTALGSCSDQDRTNGNPEWVTISGIAFEFGPSPVRIPDVRVFIAEVPAIETVTDDQGAYVLQVPDGRSVTPVAETNGFPRMHLQTFLTEGQDLTDVNFQLVPEVIFDMFAAVLETEPDPDRCQISTTVNVAAIRGLTFEEFVAYGPHGVEGATAGSEPAIDPACGPVYFDERTFPDKTLTETTIDGGVVWFNVPPGVYAIRAEHPTLEFSTFVATCEPGRFINAGPPWGLREIVPESAP